MSLKSADIFGAYEYHFLEWIILLSPFLFGGYFPWTSSLISIALIVLLVRIMHCGTFRKSASPVFLTAAAIVLFHLAGMLWGTDRGMALVGAIQFLPLPLFVLAVEQLQPEQRGMLIHKMPYAAGIMVILSFCLSRIPLLESWFLTLGRQGGFFQYPNTYAVYLLLAVVLVLFGGSLRFGPLPWLIVLVLGIAFSGSRTVTALLFPVLIVYLFWEKSRKRRVVVLGLFALLLAGGAVYVIITGNYTHIGRLLTTTLHSTELLSRAVYVQDALPVIFRHPLGLGYAGYHWLQGSFQTSLYSVRFVHNELLQLMLDVGWIPALLFLWALYRAFRSGTGGFLRKLLLSVLCLHCLLDFDTQFVSIALLLFLWLDAEPQASRSLKNPHLGILPLLGAALLSLWIGLSSFASYTGNLSAAVRIYPGNTQAMADLLPECSEQELEPLADRILRLNDSVALAHDAKARTLFSSGSITGMREHKLEAIHLAKYYLPEYLDYFDYLRYSYDLYLQQGDQSSAQWCLDQLREIPEMLEDVKSNTSRLGWMIGDLLSLDLPKDYVKWLSAHA